MTSFVGRFYFSLRGRTSRRFYWLFGVIPLFSAAFVLGFGLGVVAPYAPAIVLFSLVALAPVAIWVTIALHVKRLHDIGVSGWWMIAVWAISVLVALLVAYFLSVRAAQLSSLAVWAIVGAIPGTPGVNRFGPNPARSQGRPLQQSDVPAA